MRSNVSPHRDITGPPIFSTDKAPTRWTSLASAIAKEISINPPSAGLPSPFGSIDIQNSYPLSDEIDTDEYWEFKAARAGLLWSQSLVAI